MNYFSEDELKCQHCGKYKFDEGVLKILNAIRREFGPMPVNSGYRCVDHPIEAKSNSRERIAQVRLSISVLAGAMPTS